MNCFVNRPRSPVTFHVELRYNAGATRISSVPARASWCTLSLTHEIFAKAPDGGGQWRSRQIFCVVFSSLLSAGAVAQRGPRAVLPGVGPAQSATSPSDAA